MINYNDYDSILAEILLTVDNLELENAWIYDLLKLNL